MIEFRDFLEDVKEKLVLLSLVREVNISVYDKSEYWIDTHIFLDGKLCFTIIYNDNTCVIKKHQPLPVVDMYHGTTEKVVERLELWVGDLLNGV